MEAQYMPRDPIQRKKLFPYMQRKIHIHLSSDSYDECAEDYYYRRGGVFCELCGQIISYTGYGYICVVNTYHPKTPYEHEISYACTRPGYGLRLFGWIVHKKCYELFDKSY